MSNIKVKINKSCKGCPYISNCSGDPNNIGCKRYPFAGNETIISTKGSKMFDVKKVNSLSEQILMLEKFINSIKTGQYEYLSLRTKGNFEVACIGSLTTKEIFPQIEKTIKERIEKLQNQIQSEVCQGEEADKSS